MGYLNWAPNWLCRCLLLFRHSSSTNHNVNGLFSNQPFQWRSRPSAGTVLNGARPSAVTVLTEMLEIFSFSVGLQWFRYSFIQLTSSRLPKWPSRFREISHVALRDDKIVKAHVILHLATSTIRRIYSVARFVDSTKSVVLFMGQVLGLVDRPAPEYALVFVIHLRY